jgi:hypothetical protein
MVPHFVDLAKRFHAFPMGLRRIADAKGALSRLVFLGDDFF